MTTKLMAKIDRLDPQVTELPPGEFFEVVTTLPGLAGALFMEPRGGGQSRVGLWLWEGREGHRAGTNVLLDTFPIGPPPMVEERVWDVVESTGSMAGADGLEVHVAYLQLDGVDPEEHTTFATRVVVPAFARLGAVAQLVLTGPSGRDLCHVVLWREPPTDETIKQSVPDAAAELGISLPANAPYRVEKFDVRRAIVPVATAQRA